MLTPKGRGALSDRLFQSMRRGGDTDWAALSAQEPDDAADAQIALWAMYELHYRGFDDVDPSLEWNAGLLGVRAGLEATLEDVLRQRFVMPVFEGAFDEALFAFIEGHDGASLANVVRSGAEREQVLDLLRSRSIYHLKESNPSAWVVPRLTPRPQAALMELQFDEYGAGDPNRLHSHLFALGLERSGLSAEYGAYINDVPVEVLEANNAMTLFGLHRRLRGAAMGHLAAVEATSSLPSRRMVQGLSRLGFPSEMVHYYEEHVEADAVHEQLAVRLICGAMVDEDPALVEDIVFGAFTALDQENRFAERMLAEWQR